MYVFPLDIRKHVSALAELIYEANRKDTREWSSTDGVYGRAQSTLYCLVAICVGSTVARHVAEVGINWGSHTSPIDDVEAAIGFAQRAVCCRINENLSTLREEFDDNPKASAAIKLLIGIRREEDTFEQYKYQVCLVAGLGVLEPELFRRLMIDLD